MTPAQYRTAIDRLGLSQRGAARFLGIDERTSRRYASDYGEIPETISKFLRFLVAAKITPEEVEKVLMRR